MSPKGTSLERFPKLSKKKNSEEFVDHLLIHCTHASCLWSFVLYLFGVSWVKPRQVVDLMVYWKGGSRHCQAVEIWGTIPLCLVGTIWREQIIRIFEGEEHSILDLQQFFLGSLYEWMTVRSGFSVPSLVEFLDLCSFY